MLRQTTDDLIEAVREFQILGSDLTCLVTVELMTHGLPERSALRRAGRQPVFGLRRTFRAGELARWQVHCAAGRTRLVERIGVLAGGGELGQLHRPLPELPHAIARFRVMQACGGVPTHHVHHKAEMLERLAVRPCLVKAVGDVGADGLADFRRRVEAESCLRCT